MKRRSQPKTKRVPARTYGTKLRAGNMMYGPGSKQRKNGEGHVAKGWCRHQRQIVVRGELCDCVDRHNAA